MNKSKYQLLRRFAGVRGVLFIAICFFVIAGGLVVCFQRGRGPLESSTSPLLQDQKGGRSDQSRNMNETIQRQTGKPGGNGVSLDIVARLSEGGKPLEQSEKQMAIALMRSGDIAICKEVLSRMPIGPLYEMLLGEFAERYSKEDLQGSFEWLAASPPEGHMENAYSRIGRSACTSPVKAERFIESISDRGLKAEFSAGYLMGLTQSQNKAVLKEILASRTRTETLGLSGDIVFGTVVGQLASSKELGMAFSCIDSMVESGISISGGGAEMAAGRLAECGLSEVITYLEREETKSGVKALVALPTMEKWGSSDPIRASEWLAKQNGDLRDYGAAGLVRAIAKTEPQSAVKWALSISQADLRLSALRDVSYRSKFERVEVRNIIQSSGYPQAAKDEYTELFK